MLRWVRYEAPVMVCVDVDDDGNDRVVNVVVGEEAEDIRLARDADGQPLVYDEYMQRLDPDDPTAQRAAGEAEDREWPDADTWEAGPDALRFPGLYDRSSQTKTTRMTSNPSTSTTPGFCGPWPSRYSRTAS